MYSPFIIRKFHAKLTKKKVSLDSFSQAPTLVFFLIDQQYLVKKKKKRQCSLDQMELLRQRLVMKLTKV